MLVLRKGLTDLSKGARDGDGEQLPDDVRVSLDEGREVPELASGGQSHPQVDDGPLVHLHHHGQGLGLVFSFHTFLLDGKKNILVALAHSCPGFDSKLSRGTNCQCCQG